MLQAPAEIIELVDKFERNINAYKNPSYKEEQLKQEFINPFFKALGWDIDNTTGAAPQYRDVIFEDSIKIAGGTRAPDYCFTLAGRKMFFVEAKKPSVNIDKNIKPSYQLRRYAWSAKLPLSILTDFEELAVYDSRTTPKKTDRTTTGRIKYLTYKDYVDQWDYLYNTFSKDAVLKGSYDKYAETTKKKKGTTLVDDEFLSEIETWRELLAKDIALRNSDLTVDELNYSVQQIIDRIIFLRMAEDRGAEKYGQLQKLLNKQAIFQELCEIWKSADEKYNSGLFHFKNEKTQKSPPDTLTPQLEIKDGIFKQIIKNLYYPDSPYEFSVLSPEILGNVYEQFLGKVIRLTTGHRAKIEEKPEVKKAGGVYYTPQYIVEYIVENTIGKLCRDKTPQKVSELRILDPACGSGSFLLGAYNYLLNWHLIYYSNLKDKNRLKDQIYKGKNNEWHLTIKEKKRILLNNIYGVDIDRQAVEVTKLSLLLKVLEGENRDVLEAQQKLYKERALPDLENNIKCGNSLISPEIYNNQDLQFTAEELKHINAFNWNNEFGDIMDNGGFDTIIGNPPYGAILSNNESIYIQNTFVLQDYQLDTYLLFIERSIHFLKDNGLFGMIIPNTWLLNFKIENIRRYIFSNTEIVKVVHFLFYVFKATVDTEISIIKKASPKKNHQIKIEIIDKDRNIDTHNIKQVNWIDKGGKPVNIFEKQEFITITDKMKNLDKLDELFLIRQGTKPFQKGKGKPPQTEKIVQEKPFVSHIKNDVTFRPLLRGSMMHKYKIKWDNDYWISFGDWLAEPRYSANYDAPKIIIRQTGDSPIATIDNSKFIVRDNLYAITTKKDELNEIDLRYILGIINSNLIKWFYQKILNPEKGEALAQVKRGHIAQFPIKVPILDDEIDKKQYELMVNLVNQMIQLNTDIDIARTPQDRELMQRQIDATDKQIDKLVYELYGLTKEEIKIVEDMG
ncbi:Eco57I restriction-modification methylase domain-containing protein [Methanobacterium spitsbergense]|uniref:site-specific DNA-methyltransferase (adenine-specific) n=1 Tax=Methanobacterium spitsbergense TaxID=2874285 RepID=A0A8T5UWK0_9EURY|nr:TaqI-like C-terminal specificity domain-containing protein [Methanobacterium spitsbergense]MBZ2165213.1 N-6 DNA methylase [Methanobacterium spitsbergense]